MGTIDTFRDEAEGRSRARRFRSAYLGKLIQHLVRTILWIDGRMERQRSRRALLELTDDQLKDIGVSRSEAHGEGTRRFWD